MRQTNKRQRILKVEKRTTHKIVAIVTWAGGRVCYKDLVDTFYSVQTKQGCVAYDVSKRLFNVPPQPGMFIRLCRNKKQFEITR